MRRIIVRRDVIVLLSICGFSGGRDVSGDAEISWKSWVSGLYSRFLSRLKTYSFSRVVWLAELKDSGKSMQELHLSSQWSCSSVSKLWSVTVVFWTGRDGAAVAVIDTCPSSPRQTTAAFPKPGKLVKYIMSDMMTVSVFMLCKLNFIIQKTQKQAGVFHNPENIPQNEWIVTLFSRSLGDDVQ